MKQKPTKIELLKLLVPIAHKWYNVGIALEVRDGVLMSLRCSNNSNLTKLFSVIKFWIDTQSTPVTWETVIFAVESPIVNNMQLAAELRNYLTQLNLSNTVTDIEKPGKPGKGINYMYVCSLYCLAMPVLLRLSLLYNIIDIRTYRKEIGNNTQSLKFSENAF